MYSRHKFTICSDASVFSDAPTKEGKTTMKQLFSK